MLLLSKSGALKGFNRPLHSTSERGTAFEHLKRKLLKLLALFLVNPNKPFVSQTDARNYAMGAVLQQTHKKRNHYPFAFWSRVLIPSQRKSRTPRTKEDYAIVIALRKWAGNISPQPICVCTGHQSLRTWHTECVDTPSGPAAHAARWHETFSNFDLSVLYVPGKDNTIADVRSHCLYPAGRAL